MIVEDNASRFDLDLVQFRMRLPLVNHWNAVSVRNAFVSWMMRTLSADLSAIRVTVYKEKGKYQSCYTYTFRVDFRERGGGEWSAYTRYVVDVPAGLGSYKGSKIHTLADALHLAFPEINRVFSSVGEDISHLLTFYGATFAVREGK